MRKTNIPPQKLQRIIELKEQDASWLRIERETHIPRRTAKRAYDQLSKDRIREDAKKARSSLIVEEVRKHIDEVMKLAEFIAGHLEIPSLVEIEKGPSAYIDDLFLNRPAFIPIPAVQFGVTLPEGLSEKYLGVSESKRSRQFYRENRMLFKALETHTRQGARWGGIDDWENAWDECKGVLNNARNEALQIIKNILNQKKDLEQKIKAKSGEDAVIDAMAKLVVEAVWQAITNDQLEQGIPLIEIVPGTGSVKFSTGPVIQLNDNDLAVKVAEVCNWSAVNLCKGDTVSLIPTLIEKVEVLKRSIDRVEEDYNRLVLRPIILSTRCALCL